MLRRLSDRVSGVPVVWERKEGWGRSLTGIGGDEGSCLHAALDVVKIPDFVQLIRILALNDSRDTARGFQCRQNSRRGIGRCRRGHDTRVRQPGI